MGGATSHASQSGAQLVSKWLIPLIEWYAVIGCKLQDLHTILHAQYYASEVWKTCSSLVQVLQNFLQVSV